MGLLDDAQAKAKVLAGLLADYYQNGAQAYFPTEADVKARPDLAKGLLQFVPGPGDAIAGYDAMQSAKQGNYGEAALNGVGLLPFIPAMGGMTKKAGDYLYHGTGEGAFRKILEKGLSPVNGKGYLSDSEQYARTYASRKGAPFGERVLRVKKADSFVPDTSNSGGDYLFNSVIPTSNIEVNVNGKWIPIDSYSDESIGILRR